MKLPHRRKFLHLAAGAAALPAVSRIAWAQPYPTQPVKIIVSFGAGGSLDILTRLLGEQLGRNLGQQFVIDNRPGAAGNLAAEIVAKSEADGYTLLAATGAFAANATLYTNLRFDPRRRLPRGRSMGSTCRVGAPTGASERALTSGSAAAARRQNRRSTRGG
jgi:tripartite-type tricarboxylate transporter receptor subunit TctC